jgi:hypothetical protein
MDMKHMVTSKKRFIQQVGKITYKGYSLLLLVGATDQ